MIGRWSSFEVSLFEKPFILFFFSPAVLHLQGRVILALEPLIEVAFTEEENSCFLESLSVVLLIAA